MSYYIEIEWPTGPILYSKYGVYKSNSQAIPLLKAVSNISRVLIHYEFCENSSASIELSDHTAHFTEKLNNTTDKYCVGKRVKIFQGSFTVFTGYISTIPEIKSRICNITIDLFTALDKTINRQITKDEFQKVPAENEGKWGNIIYGFGSTITGKMFTAYRCGDNKYLAAWNTLSEITGACKGDVDISSQITMSIDTKGYTYILYTSTELEISFSALGPLESGALIENPARMLDALTSQFTTITISNVNDIATAYDDRIVYNGNCLWTNDDKTIKEFLSEFCFNFDSSLIFTRDGQFMLNMINWGNITPKATPHPTVFSNLETWKESSYLLKKAQRMYQYIPAQNKYNRMPQDLNAATNWNSTLKELQHKHLQNNQTSWDVCARYVYVFQEQEEMCSFQIPMELVSLHDINVGDTVSVRHRKTNKVEKLVYLRRENQSSNKPFIGFEGIDVTPLTGNEFILYSGDDTRNPTLTADDGPILF